MDTFRLTKRVFLRLGVFTLLLTVGLCRAYAGKTVSKSVKVGDTFTVNTTSHSYLQSVLWNYDWSVVEPLDYIYETTTSVTFRALKPVSVTAIQATTYYYRSGTTSTGINKDVDVFQIYIEDNGGSTPSNYSVSLSESTINLSKGESFNLYAYVDGGTYSGSYDWVSSNPSSIYFYDWGNYITLKADNPGSSTVSVTLDNGSTASCEVNVLGGNSDESGNSFNKDGIYYNILSNEDRTCEVTFGSKKYTGNVVIPSTVSYNGKNFTVISIGDYAFRDCSSLSSVEIPNPVTSIGDSAFYYCKSLTSVEIPNSVTSIGECAFYYCESLTSVEIPNSVTSIEKGAFAYCKSLTSVEIPNSVTSISNSAFLECTELKSVMIPNSVTFIDIWAFASCYRLTSVEIPNSVTYIGNYAFYECWNLTSVEIPNSVTSIGKDAFLGCLRLTSVVIPNSVTSIGDKAFLGCSRLTSVEIPNSVTSIGQDAFTG